MIDMNPLPLRSIYHGIVGLPSMEMVLQYRARPKAYQGRWIAGVHAVQQEIENIEALILIVSHPAQWDISMRSL